MGNERQIFNSVDALAEQILDALHTGVIGVDGWTGAGKTRLARALASKTSADFFDIDCILTRGLGRYVDAVPTDKVAQRVGRSQGLLFVSGICLRQILSNARIEAAKHVYVKRLAVWGWEDEADALREVCALGDESLIMEMRRYHREWRPHEASDYEFQRFD